MVDSETESSAKDAKNSDVKFQLKEISEIKKLEHEELCNYISQLHEELNKKDKKIHKYKEKYKELLKQLKDNSKPKTNNVGDDADKATPDIHTADAAATTTTTNATNTAETTVDAAAGAADLTKETEDNIATVDSFVDEIRKAAEQAQNLNGFVYEPTSGLYYDQKTGYYYNAEYGLYYDGHSGCYYNYNQEKNIFEFHSQVQTPQIQKSAEADIDGNEEDEVMVEFDEFGGVITDKELLKKIKEERRKEEEEERAWRKKKKSKSITKSIKKSAKHSKKRKHKSKKRKQRKHSSDDDSAQSESESAEGGEKGGRSKTRKRARKRSCDVEDGELSTSSSSSSSSSGSENDSGESTDSGREVEGGKTRKKVATFSGGGRFQDIAKKYPPSLRIIVQESNLDGLKVGSLSLITYKGGSLGREGDHDVIIPDVNVSKLHMKFHYDHKKSIYKCIDLGSRNGTILNGKRMSSAKKASAEYDLVHGSVLQIAQTKLLCHVHEGNSTCGLCEPGLLMNETTARESSAAAAACNTVALTHREQLKKLQKKYGLEKEKFVETKCSNDSNYNDRAATRRIKIGSSTDGEKTQTASVNTEISSENKGFKMLAKLGWNKGETLGKGNGDGTGLLEPINVSSNEGKKGLGCDISTPSSLALSQVDKRKIATWQKTQARYKQTDIFGDSEESS